MSGTEKQRGLYRTCILIQVDRSALIRDIYWCIIGVPWIIRFFSNDSEDLKNITYHVTITSAPICHTVDSAGLVMWGTQTSREVLGANNGEA